MVHLHHLPTFAIKIKQMLVNVAYMDGMGLLCGIVEEKITMIRRKFFALKIYELP